jgi:hypothetical protein
MPGPPGQGRLGPGAAEAAMPGYAVRRKEPGIRQAEPDGWKPAHDGNWWHKLSRARTSLPTDAFADRPAGTCGHPVALGR